MSKRQKTTPYKRPHTPNKKTPVDRKPASSGGVRQVTSLAKLPTLSKTLIINEQAGEVELHWRLRFEDSAKALQLMRLVYEANGWTVDEQILAQDEVA